MASRRLLGRPEALMLAALAAAAITVVAAAVIGGRHAQSSTAALASQPGTVTGGPSSTGTTYGGTLSNGPAVGPQTTAGAAVNRGGATTSATSTSPGGFTKAGERRSTVGATRVGIFKDYFLVGIHAPITDGGAPWGLADPAIAGAKGYITYINRHGGINGLKARIDLEDDQYTTDGARQAADKLTKELKPFLIEGTLGIDQIHTVALSAKAAGIPYTAGGGPEPEMDQVGMWQFYTSYDADMKGLAEYICKYGKSYVGENEVRLGTSTLNSDLILPVERRMVNYLTANHCIAPIDPNARGRINKPTEQTTYSDELQKFKGAYGGKGVNLIVPLQDPLTTSRMVAEETSYKSPVYNPKWTFSDFAHDGDLDYKLMQGQWIGVRGLSPACYYYPPNGGDQAYNTSMCAQMGEAHSEFVSLGPVTYDDNAGGCEGGHCSYTYQEGNAASDGWVKDGSEAAFGYQAIYFWVGAMKSMGTDPTREKFLAALGAYDSYSNLVTGPITFLGSSNHMAGATKFVVLEGTAQQHYRQVTEITPGLVDHF
jgi:ABC-type branched-subunit amino acid transport system substrate-binding protein